MNYNYSYTATFSALWYSSGSLKFKKGVRELSKNVSYGRDIYYEYSVPVSSLEKDFLEHLDISEKNNDCHYATASFLLSWFGNRYEKLNNDFVYKKLEEHLKDGWRCSGWRGGDNSPILKKDKQEILLNIKTMEFEGEC